MDEKRQAARNDLIDSLSPVQLVGVMVEMFGVSHSLTLIGWAINWGVLGIENGPEFRAKLASEGISRATAYRASLDFRKLGDELEKRFGVPFDTEVMHQKVLKSDLAEYCRKDERFRKDMRRTGV